MAMKMMGNIYSGKKIQLKKNITTTQFVASMFHYLFMPFIFVSVEILQPTLLKDNFHIKPEDAGTQNSNIIFIDVLVKLIFAPIFGVLTDRLGRKVVLMYGIIMVSLAISIMPFCANLYPQYLLVRCLYAHGAICVAVQPLLGDYISDSTKGRAASLSVIMASGGAMLSAQVVSSLGKYGVETGYWCTSIGYLICSLVYCFLLKGGNNYYQSRQQKERPQNRSCAFLAKIGWKASQNPWILMGYITNLMARNDSILLSMYLIIWAYDSTDQSSYEESYISGHMLAGVAYTSMFVFTIIYGVLMEKISKFWTLLVMFILTAVGGFMMIFANKPKEVYSFIVMVILGAGMSGLQTAAQFLIQKYAYKSHRGYITGLATVFSVIGILSCVASGFLIDTVSDVAPFIWTGILSVLSLAILGYCFMRHVRKYRKWTRNIDNNVQQIQDLKLNAAEKEDLLYTENPILKASFSNSQSLLEK